MADKPVLAPWHPEGYISLPQPWQNFRPTICYVQNLMPPAIREYVETSDPGALAWPTFLRRQ